MSQPTEELPESQDDSFASSEIGEPKENPFIPNPTFWWCPKCKARHDYDYSSFTSGSGSNRSATEIYSCKVCKARMFNPAQTLPWMYGLTGVGVIVFAIGLLIGLSHGEVDCDTPGPEVVFVLFAIFPPIDRRDDDPLHEGMVRLVIGPKEQIRGRTGTRSHECAICCSKNFCR